MNTLVQFPEGGRVKADLNEGFLKLSNTLVTQLMRTHLSGNETQVFMAVLSKTYGYNKKLDWVSGSQISEMTGLKKERVSEAMSKLVKRNIIVKEGRNIGPNPVVSEWLEDSKELRKSVIKKEGKITEKRNQELRKSVTGVTEKRNLKLRKSVNTKDNTKYNYTKDTITKDIKPPRKPQAFKTFFEKYPLHRKGGTDQQAWKVCKSEKLTEADLQEATDWLTQASELNPAWQTEAGGQYVFGITKFLRERIWKTPIPRGDSHASKPSTGKLSTADRQAAAAEEYLANLDSEQRDEEGDGPIVATYE